MCETRSKLLAPEAFGMCLLDVQVSGFSLHSTDHPLGRNRRKMGTHTQSPGEAGTEGPRAGPVPRIWGLQGTQRFCRHSHPWEPSNQAGRDSHQPPYSRTSCPFDLNSLHKTTSATQRTWLPASHMPGRRLALSKCHGMSRLTRNHKNLLPSC